MKDFVLSIISEYLFLERNKYSTSISNRKLTIRKKVLFLKYDADRIMDFEICFSIDSSHLFWSASYYYCYH